MNARVARLPRRTRRVLMWVAYAFVVAAATVGLAIGLSAKSDTTVIREATCDEEHPRSCERLIEALTEACRREPDLCRTVIVVPGSRVIDEQRLREILRQAGVSEQTLERIVPEGSGGSDTRDGARSPGRGRRPSGTVPRPRPPGGRSPPPASPPSSGGGGASDPPAQPPEPGLIQTVQGVVEQVQRTVDDATCAAGLTCPPR